MSSENDAIVRGSPSAELNLVCGGGGSRAILGSAGAILACHVAGVRNWRTLGGASGGSFPTVMLASGMHPTEIVRLSIDVNFASLLERNAGLFQVLLAYFFKQRNKRTRPHSGVLGSKRVGEWVESLVHSWPNNFWTVAAVGQNQWLFTSSGIYEYTPEGQCRQISAGPAPLGLAIRASCAVPGIIDAVPFLGEHLFDGALTADGRCPLKIPARHFKQSPSSTIACDVGDDHDHNSWRSWFIRSAWKILCGKHCLPKDELKPHGSEETILITPTVVSFRSLQFVLTADQKWEAVMAGFVGSVPTLEEAGLLNGRALVKAKRIVSSYNKLKKVSKKSGQLSSSARNLLRKEQLY